MGIETEDGDSVKRAISRTFPLPGGDDHYVTRGEFSRELFSLEKSVDQKLQLTENRLQKWIMGGVLAFILSSGVGGLSAYTSIMAQLGQIAATTSDAKRANQRLDARTQWIVKRERHDSAQDEALRRLEPSYTPPVPDDVPQ